MKKILPTLITTLFLSQYAVADESAVSANKT